MGAMRAFLEGVIVAVFILATILFSDFLERRLVRSAENPVDSLQNEVNGSPAKVIDTECLFEHRFIEYNGCNMLII